jgi:hypothetical protein
MRLLLPGPRQSDSNIYKAGDTWVSPEGPTQGGQISFLTYTGCRCSGPHLTEWLGSDAPPFLEVDCYLRGSQKQQQGKATLAELGKMLSLF